MSDKTYLDWPFFDDAHRALAAELDAWAAARLSGGHDHVDTDAACRNLVAFSASRAGSTYCVPTAYGGRLERIDSRSLCIARETLARHDGLADFAFAMQGLGSGAISIAGSEDVQRRYLPRVAQGEAIAAFALSEPEAGSDVAAMTTSARARRRALRAGRREDLDFERRHRRLLLRVRAHRAAAAGGARGISAFVVDADTPGLRSPAAST